MVELRRSVAAVLVLLAAGCVTVPARELTRNAHLAVVQAGTDSVASVARRYGVPADELERLNGAGARLLFVPLVPVNASGVEGDSYQTVPILCYHRFTAERESAHAMEVTAASFRAQLTYLRDNGFAVVPLGDLAAFLRGELSLPERSVVITVDDGFRSFLDVAYPILEEFAYPATLFVYTDFAGAPAAIGWAELRALAAGGLVTVQSHSQTHSSLARAGDEPLRAYRSRLLLEVETPERRLPGTTEHFAYPYGDTDPELVAVLTERSYQTAVTVQRGSNPAFAAPMLLKRDMVFARHDLQAFGAMLETSRPLP